MGVTLAINAPTNAACPAVLRGVAANPQRLAIRLAGDRNVPAQRLLDDLLLKVVRVRPG